MRKTTISLTRKKKRIRISAYPKSIKEHKLSWLWKLMWRRVHSKNKMFVVVTVAEPGSGKSWLQLAMAEILDRSERDISRFNIERVCFSALEFTRCIGKDWPRGSAIVFDDSGISLFSRESMLRDIRDVCKVLQSVRFKNYLIFLSLPTLGMLDKVVRQLLNCYTEPVAIDREAEQTEAKLHFLHTDPRGGKVYHYRPIVIEKKVHPILSYTSYERTYFDTVWFDRPSIELTELYEEKKKRSLKAFYKKVIDEMEERARKKAAKDTLERRIDLISKKIEANIGLYVVEGTEAIDIDKVLMRHPDCSLHAGYMVASLLNKRRGWKKRGSKWVRIKAATVA